MCLLQSIVLVYPKRRASYPAPAGVAQFNLNAEILLGPLRHKLTVLLQKQKYNQFYITFKLFTKYVAKDKVKFVSCYYTRSPWVCLLQSIVLVYPKRRASYPAPAGVAQFNLNAEILLGPLRHKLTVLLQKQKYNQFYITFKLFTKYVAKDKVKFVSCCYTRSPWVCLLQLIVLVYPKRRASYPAPAGVAQFNLNAEILLGPLRHKLTVLLQKQKYNQFYVTFKLFH